MLTDNNSPTPADAPHAPADLLPTSADSDARVADSAASTADAPQVAAVDDELQYTLTVQQAREVFALHRRKVPAERTLQIYCQDKAIAAKKIRTTFGSEWLINEPSLLAYIAKQTELTTQDATQPATHAPLTTHQPQNPEQITSATTAPRAATTAEPSADSAATTADAPQPRPLGETRTLAQLLIENSRLLAQLEGKDAERAVLLSGKDEVIDALKDNIGFIRDELVDRRKFSSDTKQLAERMLQTLETMATRNSLPEGNSRRSAMRADIIPPSETETD